MKTELAMLMGAGALYAALMMPSRSMAAAVPAGGPAPVGWAGRAGEARASLAEAMIPFALCVLAVAATGEATMLSAMGAQLFLAARVAHAAVTLAGARWLRPPAWLAGMVGTGLVVSALFQG